MGVYTHQVISKIINEEGTSGPFFFVGLPVPALVFYVPELALFTNCAYVGVLHQRLLN
jgi:hypothetical protein